MSKQPALVYAGTGRREAIFQNYQHCYMPALPHRGPVSKRPALVAVIPYVKTTSTGHCQHWSKSDPMLKPPALDFFAILLAG